MPGNKQIFCFLWVWVSNLDNAFVADLVQAEDEIGGFGLSGLFSSQGAYRSFVKWSGQVAVLAVQGGDEGWRDSSVPHDTFRLVRSFEP